MDNIPLIQKITGSFINILKDELIGIYVHGSIAFGCFNWNRSDIDLIVVVDQELTLETKVLLMETVFNINQYAPSKGLEMSIVLKKNCQNFRYPTSYELHFSNEHIHEYKSNPVEYCEKMNGLDKDLAAHFTVINHKGIVLYGEPIHHVFGIVPIKDYFESIKSDVENAKDDIMGKPTYVILNLCRVLAYKQSRLVLSKEQGAEWALNNLDEKYKKLIVSALDSYILNRSFIVNIEAEDFCAYMLHQINH